MSAPLAVPRRSHRRSLSLGAIPLSSLGAVPESSEPEGDDALGLLARRTAMRVAKRTSMSRLGAVPESVPEEPSVNLADEADENEDSSASDETVKPAGGRRDPLVGLGIDVPQTAAPGASFSAARGSRNRLTIQAALGNLRTRQTSAPASGQLRTPLSAVAPTFQPRGIASPSPRAVSFAHLSRHGRAPSIGQRAIPSMPSLEQIAAWKRSRDEAADAAAEALIDEWPECISPRADKTPELEHSALDSAPSSPDEPKNARSIPPTPTIVNHDRIVSGRKMLSTLERRRSSVVLNA